MQNKNDWFAQYPPLQLKEETQMAEQVEKRVLRRIAESSQPTESEVLPMKHEIQTPPHSSDHLCRSRCCCQAQSPW